MDRETINNCLENICNKGCKAVWKDIDALEAGEDLVETRTLTSDEKKKVLAELKDIMFYYRNRCHT